VQKTGHIDRLLRLFAAKNILHVIIPLLVLAATPSSGQESMISVASVRYHQLSERLPVAANDYFASRLANLSSIFKRTNGKSTAPELNVGKENDFLPDVRLEKPDRLSQHDLFRLMHKELGPNEWSRRWMDVQAGYGEVCFDRADFEKFDDDWQVPACAYVKASFSF
jgi:hypothetical protein